MPFDKEHRLAEEENFKHFDVNKDMVLDANEIESWAMPSHEEAAEEEAQHLIEVRVSADQLGARLFHLKRQHCNHCAIRACAHPEGALSRYPTAQHKGVFSVSILVLIRLTERRLRQCRPGDFLRDANEPSKYQKAPNEIKVIES